MPAVNQAGKKILVFDYLVDLVSYYKAESSGESKTDEIQKAKKQPNVENCSALEQKLSSVSQILLLNWIFILLHRIEPDTYSRILKKVLNIVRSLLEYGP